jgi:cell division protein ZapA (FtsZ GTPase activity inhibitor)
MTKEWTEFDSKMAQINQIGEQFGFLETERVEILTALQAYFYKDSPEREPSFYSLAAKLPQKECSELSGLYRELKMETLRMKALNETFLTYLKEVKIIATAWLDAVYPAQGGKLYTNKGRQISGDPRSMVLNQRM